MPRAPRAPLVQPSVGSPVPSDRRISTFALCMLAAARAQYRARVMLMAAMGELPAGGYREFGADTLYQPRNPKA
jgi:hypothetical protein